MIKQGERLTVNLTEVRNENGVVQNQLHTANIKISYDEYTSMIIHGGKATKSWTSVKENNLSFALTLEADNSGQGQVIMGSPGFSYTLGATCGSQDIIPVTIENEIVSNNTIQVYPTITGGILHFVSLSPIKYIRLYTSTGTLTKMWQPYANDISISIEAVPAGMYFVEVMAENGSNSYVKIIKE